MTPRRLPAAFGLIAVLAVAGCTGSSSGSGTPTPSTGLRQVVLPITSAARLAATVRVGLAGVRTVHLTLSTSAGTEKLLGSGDLVLVGGTLSQADITQALPGGLGSMRVLISGGTTYAKLPSAIARTGKPWVKLSSSSRNPLVAQLALTINPILAIASPAIVTDIVSSASSVRQTAAHTYRIVVDSGALSALGTVKLAAHAPVDVTLADDGRPSRLSGTLSVIGELLTPTVGFSDYNAPVTITAPPAGEVDSS